jgi:hypothetical protein
MNYDLLQVNHESIIDLIVHAKDHCRLLSSYGLSNICDIWPRMILWETNLFSMLQLIVLLTYPTLCIPITLSLFKQRPPNLKSLHVAKRFQHPILSRNLRSLNSSNETQVQVQLSTSDFFNGSLWPWPTLCTLLYQASHEIGELIEWILHQQSDRSISSF